METIRFTNEAEEEGLRIIMVSGPVVYTGHIREYKVPNYVLNLLDEQNVRYEVLSQHQNGIQKDLSNCH